MNEITWIIIVSILPLIVAVFVLAKALIAILKAKKK